MAAIEKGTQAGRSRADWQELDKEHHLHPFTDHKDLHRKRSRIISRADGCYIYDADGKEILDGMSGLWCVNSGYGREELVEAAAAQLRELPYYNNFFQCSHPPAIELASMLTDLEFAPKSRWADLIEVNINNLAAVPSIVYGLLGLAVFINWAGLPRSAPLVGGLVLSLLTLPVIIIASRAAIQSVPPSIRQAALGLGASQMQMVFHHVLPLAMPGMLTGAIIGMSRALGESAPLLMIGMIAFIVDVPGGFTDPATALPVQIYLWADSPERAFAERTSAAIIVLLGFLLLMNLAAVIIRKRMERKW